MGPPEQLSIDTPEQLALEFPLAGAGSRFLALAIDTALQLVVFASLAVPAVVLIRAVSLVEAWQQWMQAGLLVAGFLIYYGYFVTFESLWAGQTPGKRLVGLRVIRSSGHPIGAFDAFVRNLLRIVDQLPGIYAVGLVAVFFSPRNQRLGDLAAGTVVVHEPLGRFDPTAASSPSSPRLGAARLSADEINAVEAFLARRAGLSEELWLGMSRQLADRLRRRLEVPASLYEDDQQLIEAVAAEYRRRG